MPISTNDESDRLSHYEHYVLVETEPVRFLVNKQGSYYGAERPGNTQGSLKPAPTLISTFQSRPEEFDPISEEEFAVRVQSYVPRGPASSKCNIKT